VAGADGEFRGSRRRGQPELADACPLPDGCGAAEPDHSDALDALIAAWCGDRSRAEVRGRRAPTASRSRR
jgi:hypothetical protein